jgi:hypothetical protein
MSALSNAVSARHGAWVSQSFLGTKGPRNHLRTRFYVNLLALNQNTFKRHDLADIFKPILGAYKHCPRPLLQLRLRLCLPSNLPHSKTASNSCCRGALAPAKQRSSCTFPLPQCLLSLRVDMPFFCTTFVAQEESERTTVNDCELTSLTFGAYIRSWSTVSCPLPYI